MTEIKTRLLDLAAIRPQEMDAAGIAYPLLSLTAAGIQAEPDPQRAAARARQANDALAEVIAGTPARYGGSAALPKQDPQAAVLGLERRVTQLRFPGVMLNRLQQYPCRQGWLVLRS